MNSAHGASGSARVREASIPMPKNRWWKHVLIPAVVALIVGGLLLASAGDTIRSATPVRVHPVVFSADRSLASQPADNDTAVAPARRGLRAVQAPGWLEADPYFIACTALTEGFVEEMLVLEGDRVEAGQVLARLIADDAEISLSLHEAELASARADLAVAQAEVVAARTDWEHPVERDRAVESTTGALSEIEGELAQLPSLIAAEEAMLDRMREEYERLREVDLSEAASRIEVVIAEKDAERQAARVAAIRKREAILTGKRDRLKAEVRAAERNAALRISERLALDRAEAELLHADATVLRAESRVAEARLRLDRMTIAAPISGYVQHRLKLPGDKVFPAMDDSHSAHLYHLYDPAKMQVRVDVPLADAANVYVGERCEVIVDVLPDETFAGEVTRITHLADLQKNTLEVKVRVINPSPLLRPEMLTRVKFIPDGGGSGGGASTEPADAPDVRVRASTIDTRDGAAAVWAVRSRRGDVGRLERVGVEVIGGADGDWVSVRGALRTGDLVAEAGGSLRADARVRVVQGDAG